MEDRLPGEGLADLVELGDPAALLRAVDGLCASRDWAALVDLRRRLEEAVERGRPLWPVTTYVEYRLALDAPAPEAAGVLRPGAARFALGPLTEVAAATHSFAELAPHLGVPSVAGSVAQERVLRGEDLRGVPGAHGEVLELPLVLASWEPAYPLATYRPDEREVPDPGAEAGEIRPSRCSGWPRAATASPGPPETITARASPPDSEVQTSTRSVRARVTSGSSRTGPGSARPSTMATASAPGSGTSRSSGW